MASSDDLKSFVENLLLRFDPSIDLSTGSPAETQIVQPILDRFADDPFSVDIATFLRDRLVQEFPDLAADNGGQLEDLLTNPLQLFLEPFKREIELVKLNQSVVNAPLMADTEADALGANFFEDREPGAFSGGSVRLYFAAPVTVNVTTDKKLYTNTGLNFFPVENFKISTAQMLFNRQGNLYFMDVVVQAELAGDNYNVDIGDIANIDDVPGVVKVSNLSKFTDGSPREDNITYLGRIPQALTERSLVTERGIQARIPGLFTTVRAMSVVGAGDPGMDRDIAQGTSEGYLHLVASTSVYFGDWILVTDIVYRDRGVHGDLVMQPGDALRFYVEDDDGALVLNTKIVTIVPATTLSDSVAYILIVDLNIESKLAELGGKHQAAGSIAVFKPGFITISEVPGGISSEFTVPDDTVHLGGHTDVFVRPNSDTQLQDSLPNITDDTPILAIASSVDTDLTVTASTGSPSNVAFCNALDFATAGVRAGDILVIETSNLAGSYRILRVGDPTGDAFNHKLRLDTLFVESASQLRARIVRNIHIDLVSPKIPKLPFDTGSVSDLSTTVGSTLFRLQTINIQSFGAAIGDIIRVVDGPDAGDFTITAFDGVLGGQGPIVDRAAGASGANLRYEVFTASTGLTLPLVRIKTIELLDSTNQGTGITVPYGDAVDIRPTCDLDGAGAEIRVLDSQVFILPDGGASVLGGLSDVAVTPGAGKDARYSQEIESFDGIYRAVSTQDGGNPITENEINLPPFLYNGLSNKLMAFTTRKDPNFTAFPSGDNRTSDIAESKIGDSITILDGPNKGSYLITDLRILDMWGVASPGHHKIALVEVEPEFPSDPVKSMMDLIAFEDFGDTFTGTDILKIFLYATDFFNVSGFWALLQTRLQAALVTAAISIDNDALDAMCRLLSFTGYAVGPSARGTFRLYFQEPVSAEFRSGVDPTRFMDLTQTGRLFRIDPTLPDAQILPESEVSTLPSLWNRNFGMQWYVDGGSPDAFLFEATGSAFVRRGITDNDVLELYQAVNDLPARDQMNSSWVCVTQAGSNIVTLLLPGIPGNVTSMEAGQLFFIDSGPDIGAYTITEIITDELNGTSGGSGVNPFRPIVQFRIDKTLTHSTQGVPGDFDVFQTARPGVPSDFSTGTSRLVTGESRVYHDSFDGAAVPGTDWLSIYATDSSTVSKFGDDTRYLGTFAITAQDTDGFGIYVSIDRSPNFPDSTTTVDGATPFEDTTEVFWIIHTAPTVPPAATSDGGTVLSDQFVRGRLYDSVKQSRVVNIPWLAGDPLVDHIPDTDPAAPVGTDQIKLFDESGSEDPVIGGSFFLSAFSFRSFYAHKAPFRVIRPGTHRISSTSMALKREGALYYTDIPIVGYGPQAEMNILESTPLTIKENALIAGYQLVVENSIFTFSDQEQVSITIPSSILPVGSTPSLDNQISLAGQTLQITYDSAPLVEELQRFFDSPLDRVVAASYLLRHFLPAYVFTDITYVGGSDTGVIAADLISYINSIPPAVNQIVASSLERLVQNRGATKVTLPITLVALVHDINRKVRGLRSPDAIGAGDIPIFAGTYAQTYFIAGPDTSLVQPRPNGEQVFLKRV